MSLYAIFIHFIFKRKEVKEVLLCFIDFPDAQIRCQWFVVTDCAWSVLTKAALHGRDAIKIEPSVETKKETLQRALLNSVFLY